MRAKRRKGESMLHSGRRGNAHFATDLEELAARAWGGLVEEGARNLWRGWSGAGGERARGVGEARGEGRAGGGNAKLEGYQPREGAHIVNT